MHSFSFMKSTSKDNPTSYKTLDVAVSSISKKRLVKTELKITSFYILLLQVYKKKKIPLEMYSAKIKNSKAFFGIEKKICLRVNSFSFRNVTFDKEELEIKTRLQSPTCFQSGPARR